MSQAKLLKEVLQAVCEMPSERSTRIYECKRKIQDLVREYGDDGKMALAIEGLIGAAEAEQEEVRARLADVTEYRRGAYSVQDINYINNFQRGM